MTWAETSSSSEQDLYPLVPPAADLPSGPPLDSERCPASDLEAELGSWDEAPVALAEDAGLSAMGERAQALGYLWVELPPPGPEFRGRLGLYIEEGLETKLEQLGAPPAGIHASTSLDGSLSDQLYRARFVERRGLALGIPSLEGIANLGRTLDADDSSVLRWWIAATADRPVRLVLSTRNQFLRVYPSPVLFDSLFELAPAPVSPRAPSVAFAESSGAMDLSDLPPQVAEEEAPFREATRVEATTDVLGTRVAAVVDVPLPGLDRALGLLDEDGTFENHAFAGAQPDDCEDPTDLYAQEHELREAITLAPPPEVDQMLDQELELARADAALLLSIPDEVLPEAPPVAEPVQAGPATRPAADPPRIDADEFLRVLEADSQPPPVAAPQSAVSPSAVPPGAVPHGAIPQSAAPAEGPLALADADVERPDEPPTPLPAKRLRRPFLRMAEDSSAPVAAVEPAAAAPVTAEPVAAEPVAAEPVATAEPVTARRVAPSAPASRAGTKNPAQLELPSAASETTTRALPALDTSDPFNQLAAKEWRSWRDALSHAAGPRPLAAIERMFVTDYTRLAEAKRRGIADDTAGAALEQWQASFQKSYAETFDALRVRGKRPTMVLDLPDIAQRLGRLQGARRVQLLLIDGLRFDLGLMVQDRLRAKVDAALTERLLLWSALPSTTTYQLELLGKGPEGLLERWDGEESPALVARGRAARTARRIRTGRVEVQKIDVVEDALRTLGRPILERFDDIASEAADAIAEHMAAQAPRTLVIVFGDHGFRLDPARAGTTEEVRQGGSSPEEVLVPAFAWLTGAVH